LSQASVRIERAIVVPAYGGYYNEDLAAIRAGAAKDGFLYVGETLTAGFSRIKEPSEAGSVVLMLDNGQTVSGDALSVEFAGAAGRAERFRWDNQVELLQAFCERLETKPLSTFLPTCEELESEPSPDGLNLPAAMYGISQALLQAVAIANGRTSAEVLAGELGVEVASELIPINIQTGEDRCTNVDKAILKRADVLPHGLINDIDATFGANGELLLDYVAWVAQRIETFGAPDYHPELHLDVYGLPGLVFNNNETKIADYLTELSRRAQPYQLCVETPVLMGSRPAQIEKYGAIRAVLAGRDTAPKLVVDEWANTFEDISEFIEAGVSDMINVKSPDLGAVGNAAKAVLACWEGGVRPILGGSCTDTDQSARVMSHVALACRPAWVLARPGMGVDEAFQVVRNEMSRTLAVIAARAARQ
jgi:methylaspartate ammonia-lyase